MKKLSILIGLLLLSACSKEGEVTKEPKDFIEIHGKIYKLMRVTPCESCNDIWIMYPKDSLDSQPNVINWNEQQGKTTANKTLIKVD